MNESDCGISSGDRIFCYNIDNSEVIANESVSFEFCKEFFKIICNFTENISSESEYTLVKMLKCFYTKIKKKEITNITIFSECLRNLMIFMINNQFSFVKLHIYVYKVIYYVSMNVPGDIPSILFSEFVQFMHNVITHQEYNISIFYLLKALNSLYETSKDNIYSLFSHITFENLLDISNNVIMDSYKISFEAYSLVVSFFALNLVDNNIESLNNDIRDLSFLLTLLNKIETRRIQESVNYLKIMNILLSKRIVSAEYLLDNITIDFNSVFKEDSSYNSYNLVYALFCFMISLFSCGWNGEGFPLSNIFRYINESPLSENLNKAIKLVLLAATTNDNILREIRSTYLYKINILNVILGRSRTYSFDISCDMSKLFTDIFKYSDFIEMNDCTEAFVYGLQCHMSNQDIIMKFLRYILLIIVQFLENDMIMTLKTSIEKTDFYNIIKEINLMYIEFSSLTNEILNKLH